MAIAEALPEFNIPCTTAAVVPVAALLALMLLAVEVLPMVLLWMVADVAEPVVHIPLTDAETPTAFPITFIAPMLLLEMANVPLEAEPIPIETPPVVEMVI